MKNKKLWEKVVNKALKDLNSEEVSRLIDEAPGDDGNSAYLAGYLAAALVVLREARDALRRFA